MPDSCRSDRETAALEEFPDVLAEFGPSRPPQPYGEAGADDPDCQEWPEPENDELGLLGHSAQAATIDYRCTREELEEAGYGNGYSEVGPGFEDEFTTATEASRDSLRVPPGCRLWDLMDSVERFDWTAVPGLRRLMNALIDGVCETCPLLELP